MDYKTLIERLEEWNENLISELCADDVLTCDDLCGCTKDCIVTQAVTAITELLERAEKAEQERDAAVRDINLVLRQEYYLPCIACKNSRDGEPCEGLQLEGFTCRANAGWRGVQEE